MKDSPISFMGDYKLRKDAGEFHHYRNNKAKYKNVDLTLFEQPRARDDALYSGVEPNQNIWTNRALIKAARPRSHLRSTNGGSKLTLNNRGHWHSCLTPERRKPLRGFGFNDEIDFCHDGNSFVDDDCADNNSDIMYSFDRATGPSYGSDILSQALNKAVVKFETNQLDKLVKDEYDIISSEESNSEEDEEYEMV